MILSDRDAAPLGQAPSPMRRRRIPSYAFALSLPYCLKRVPLRATFSPKIKYRGHIHTIPVAMSTTLADKGLILTFVITVATLLPVTPVFASGLGVRNELLAECQSGSVSCVSSQDDAPSSFLEPWEYDENLNQLQERLISIVQMEPHAYLVAREARYLRFEIVHSTTAVDDLEFFFPSQDNVVHFRSARRDGSFDFLLNRRRMDRIRQKARLVQIPVLRNRRSSLNIFETPFDAFGPSAVDVDALIDNDSLGTRPVR